jgi:hypothetical protein
MRWLTTFDERCFFLETSPLPWQKKIDGRKAVGDGGLPVGLCETKPGSYSTNAFLDHPGERASSQQPLLVTQINRKTVAETILILRKRHNDVANLHEASGPENRWCGYQSSGNAN